MFQVDFKIVLSIDFQYFRAYQDILQHLPLLCKDFINPSLQILIFVFCFHEFFSIQFQVDYKLLSGSLTVLILFNLTDEIIIKLLFFFLFLFDLLLKWFFRKRFFVCFLFRGSKSQSYKYILDYLLRLPIQIHMTLKLVPEKIILV